MPDLPIVPLVEDDLLLQSILDEALVQAGFATATAASAEEAATLFQGDVMPLKVLVTDINLRGVITGWQIAKLVRELDPTFPVVYMTGDAADDWGANGVPNSILLVKPFAPSQLVTAISQLLNVGRPGQA